MISLLNTLRNLLCLALGLFQLLAITLGLHHWLGYHWIITLLMAVPITPIPVVGTLVAIWAATQAWSWPLVQSCAVFLVPLAIIMVLTYLVSDDRTQKSRG